MKDRELIDVLKGFADCNNQKDCRKCRNFDRICSDGVAENVYYYTAAQRLEELSEAASGQGLTMNEYQRLAARTIAEDWTVEQKLHHALHGLASEVGEIHGIFQKNLQGHVFTRSDLQKEIGDALWFIAELCTVYDFKLSDVAQMNVDKLKKRYPDGFSAARSVYREETEA